MFRKLFKKQTGIKVQAPIPNTQETVLSTNKSDAVPKEKPRICLIDVAEADSALLLSEGFNCVSGSFGSIIEVPNTERHECHQCLLNHDFPPNLHEYDIIVVDLQISKTIAYNPADHVKSKVKDTSTRLFVSKFPQTLFDPRPFSAAILKSEISELKKRDSIIIVFGCEDDEIEYQTASITRDGLRERDKFKLSTYSFLNGFPNSHNVFGKETKIYPRLDTDITKLLTKHNSDCTYSIIFDHPTIWQNSKRIERETFHPLMQTADGRIISYADFENKPAVFLFPAIKAKKEFLLELFQIVLPAIVPNLFPYLTLFSWLSNKPYRLPNENRLLEKKAQFEKDYAAKLKEVDEEIKNNHEDYSFLHDLLTESSDKLVKTLASYFKWLGFTEVLNMDEMASDLKQEDLQIKLERGLLVIEVKGIGGTSTDSECSQISKIRFRRVRERNSVDVSALYIVNHQRYLPPEERKNPPFSNQQIDDAINDERGLLTTYQLFKLYYHIDSGFITKEDARKALLKPGLVVFAPSTAIRLGTPTEIYHNGFVAIMKIDDVAVSKGKTIVIVNKQEFRCTKIVDLQVNGKSVNNYSNGEIGIKLDDKVAMGSELWLRNI